MMSHYFPQVQVPSSEAHAAQVPETSPPVNQHSSVPNTNCECSSLSEKVERLLADMNELKISTNSLHDMLTSENSTLPPKASGHSEPQVLDKSSSSANRPPGSTSRHTQTNGGINSSEDKKRTRHTPHSVSRNGRRNNYPSCPWESGHFPLGPVRNLIIPTAAPPKAKPQPDSSKNKTRGRRSPAPKSPNPPAPLIELIGSICQDSSPSSNPQDDNSLNF